MTAVDPKRAYSFVSAAAPALAYLTSLACLTSLVGGCRAVLGLDEPTLDTCASGCVDGEAFDATIDSDAPVTIDSGLDALSADDGSLARDGQSDTAPVIDGGVTDGGPPLGLQCGAASTATYCTAAAPVCCRLSGDASVTYSCVAGTAQCAAGSDYAILCSGTSTCGATQVCCHFNSSMKCETAKDCQKGGGDRVCDPNLPADCGDASACTRLISPLPYFACSP